jgi:hypothetical protein
LSPPGPQPCRPLIFTRASSVFIPAVPSHFYVNAMMFMTTRTVLMVYLAILTGMRRRASVPGAQADRAAMNERHA